MSLTPTERHILCPLSSFLLPSLHFKDTTCSLPPTGPRFGVLLHLPHHSSLQLAGPPFERLSDSTKQRHTLHLSPLVNKQIHTSPSLSSRIALQRAGIANTIALQGQFTHLRLCRKSKHPSSTNFTANNEGSLQTKSSFSFSSPSLSISDYGDPRRQSPIRSYAIESQASRILPLTRSQWRSFSHHGHTLSSSTHGRGAISREVSVLQKAIAIRRYSFRRSASLVHRESGLRASSANPTA